MLYNIKKIIVKKNGENGESSVFYTNKTSALERWNESVEMRKCGAYDNFELVFMDFYEIDTKGCGFENPKDIAFDKWSCIDSFTVGGKK